MALSGVEWIQVCCPMMDKECFWKLTLCNEQAIQNWSGHRESDCSVDAKPCDRLKEHFKSGTSENSWTNEHVKSSSELIMPNRWRSQKGEPTQRLRPGFFFACVFVSTFCLVRVFLVWLFFCIQSIPKFFSDGFHSFQLDCTCWCSFPFPLHDQKKGSVINSRGAVHAKSRFPRNRREILLKSRFQTRRALDTAG